MAENPLSVKALVDQLQEESTNPGKILNSQLFTMGNEIIKQGVQIKGIWDEVLKHGEQIRELEFKLFKELNIDIQTLKKKISNEIYNQKARREDDSVDIKQPDELLHDLLLNDEFRLYFINLVADIINEAKRDRFSYPIDQLITHFIDNRLMGD